MADGDLSIVDTDDELDEISELLSGLTAMYDMNPLPFSQENGPGEAKDVGEIVDTVGEENGLGEAKDGGEIVDTVGEENGPREAKDGGEIVDTVGEENDPTNDVNNDSGKKVFKFFLLLN